MASARETVRFFTMSRKFPKLIGRMYDGSKIWGGPYTTLQFTVMGIVAVLGFASKALWSTGLGLVDLLICLVVAWLIGFLAGMLPVGARSPAVLGIGLLNRITSPTAGRWDGAARPKVKPTTVESVQIGEPATTAELPVAGTEPEAAVSVPVPVSVPEERYVPAPTIPTIPATGLERLLAQTGSK